jgi:hypothetical protein
MEEAMGLKEDTMILRFSPHQLSDQNESPRPAARVA